MELPAPFISGIRINLEITRMENQPPFPDVLGLFGPPNGIPVSPYVPLVFAPDATHEEIRRVRAYFLKYSERFLIKPPVNLSEHTLSIIAQSGGLLERPPPPEDQLYFPVWVSGNVFFFRELKTTNVNFLVLDLFFGLLSGGEIAIIQEPTPSRIVEMRLGHAACATYETIRRVERPSDYIELYFRTAKRAVSAAPGIEAIPPLRMPREAPLAAFAAQACVVGFGCRHSSRLCALVCPECDRAYPCCACHDEESDHALVRKDVTHVICLLCGQRVPVAHTCAVCGIRFAANFCRECNMFSDISRLVRPFFHCEQCAACILGFADEYRHCATCGVCRDVAAFHSHTCLTPHTVCPICQEEILAQGRRAVTALPCGHFLHSDCLEAQLSHGNCRCPLCLRLCVVGPQRNTWEHSMAIRHARFFNTHTPGELSVPTLIHCLECRASFMGSSIPPAVPCPSCGSFNTRPVDFAS
eukprot:gnl/Chilomastix_cuspidata/4840.p1 GENE.gnl/Chilomastix_cuspidata/4840~~gnl/Chilomastix_cuspidata/4840.p1  ORF type:complete len:470 (+),score=119.94 gnl/Chilomastix_cuspidata/4840:48-1457(+)